MRYAVKKTSELVSMKNNIWFWDKHNFVVEVAFKGYGMLLVEKVKMSEVFEFSICPTSKIEILDISESVVLLQIWQYSCNLSCKNDKNLTETKTLRSRYAFREKKRKLLRFPSFWFCPTPKIENLEISDSVLLLQTLTVTVV